MKLFVAIAAALSLATLSTAAHADAPTEADLTSCLGGKKTWTPTVFSKLKAKMSPADVAAVLPGADQVSQYGFARIPASGCAGAAQFELYFAKNRKTDAFELSDVTIQFDASLTKDDAFYASLVKVATAKFGKVKKPDDVEKRLITWANRKFKIAQLSENTMLHGDKMLQLKTAL